MQLSTLDWSIIGAFFVVSLLIGVMAARRAGKGTGEFFLGGRNMPWWLLGVSMVATTFSADTPNLVTNIVRQNGVSGNWAWWAFLLTGMLTVFVYARLWRRSGVLTDLEFYELRYSGANARFLRIFRAVYLGVVFNVIIMATVCLAGMKLAEVLLGMDKVTFLILAGVVTVLYSAIGGLRGIIWTDFFQFGLAMVGTIWATVVILDMPEVNGLGNLLAHENVAGKLNLLPDFSKSEEYIPLLLVPLAVQWWAAYYPGAEPGGGGYVAQRMLAAKDETNAVGATLFFNIAHYALRPWPWILIALASLIIFPDLASIRTHFATIGVELDATLVKDDIAYPAMLSFLPTGLLGLVVASLIAAFMSTISTHLNWGSSYLTHDLYRRFLKPEATERELVGIGRMATVALMVLAALMALTLESALDAFNVILLIGAGTGAIYILRWFWWRINAVSEIAGMVISFVVAFGLQLLDTGLAGWQELLLGTTLTTIGWLAATFASAPTDAATLQAFYRKIQPADAGWQPVVRGEHTTDPFPELLDASSGSGETLKSTSGNLPLQIACLFVASVMVYAILFATGYFLYGQIVAALGAAVVAIGSALFLKFSWKKITA